MLQVCCPETDFIYPILADIFHPVVAQGAYGNVERTWVYDKTIPCNLAPSGTAFKEDVKPNVNIVKENDLIGRIKTDIRYSDQEGKFSVTNVIISNIRTKNGESIYNETAGPRAGKSTIYEIATLDPIVGPFGDIEYYKIIVRRSENQAADI